MTATNATPQRLYLLNLGMTDVPLPNGSKLAMVSAAYLVRMSDGSHILIDSGMPADYTPPDGHWIEKLDASNVIEQLAKLNLKPDNVEAVICTHFDIDHIGYNDHFPQAEFIVQRRHYEIASTGLERYERGRAHWGDPALRYRLVDGDTELFPGLSLIETSGHAPGHQSVLLTLPNAGKVLLAIDAVMFQRLFTTERKAGGGDDNEQELKASTQKLLDLVEREHVALIVFGHDGVQWKTLRQAPEFYD
ncbi:MAG: N-acyl homoserine lactonase family protein [Anaerolineae bacterium]|nr:N-acyl homoserine lactonase family protein [Anaerolineae bacterium]